MGAFQRGIARAGAVFASRRSRVAQTPGQSLVIAPGAHEAEAYRQTEQGYRPLGSSSETGRFDAGMPGAEVLADSLVAGMVNGEDTIAPG